MQPMRPPTREPLPQLVERQDTTIVAERSTQALNVEAFNVKLWNPPPPPAKPETVIAAEPTKPFNLQLIGIITEGAQHKAALYDPESDRILIVSAGDTVRDHVVTNVTERMIELARSDGRSAAQQLALKKEDRS